MPFCVLLLVRPSKGAFHAIKQVFPSDFFASGFLLCFCIPWQMTTKGEKSHGDLEEGPHLHRPTTDDSDNGLCFCDAEDQPWHSPCNSNRSGSAYDEDRFSGASHHEIDGVPESCRKSCVSDCSVEIDLENGISEIKANNAKVEKDCRICHLSLEESGIPIVLGCSCKGDLAAAHKQCAETWFKIKGNKTCEICGSTAQNVVVTGESEFIEQWNETSSSTAPPAPPSETRSFWQGHRFLNFLLACMVFAFVISWLFHFNVPG
ncbi:uncharacterized protein LOC103722642 isoform X1 [Phoenix dactylifera]|uniref:Uncharacterized protein LOC103722642 isoform X1 n=1 Tax=Phoenix dactylifera TaxID=42345 RepID=A0A8B7D1V2_PHODC|nr:uncharacterized protein LOC103722642 isoform X1 [Phoenix dactylifera]